MQESIIDKQLQTRLHIVLVFGGLDPRDVESLSTGLMSVQLCSRAIIFKDEASSFARVVKGNGERVSAMHRSGSYTLNR